MTNQTQSNSIQKTARFAGLMYLILAICGGFAEFAIRQGMIVPGNAAATVANIQASEMLFRLGFVAELVGQVVFVFLVLALYRILKPVDKKQADLMLVLVIVAVTITCLNMLNQFAALLVLNGSNTYLSVFATEQLNALVLLFLNMHHVGYLIAQIFFGLWLFPLGYLIVQSGFMPKLVGIMLMVACVGYLADFFLFFLYPSFPVVVSEFTFIGELLLMLWLLIKGVNVEKWQKQALVAEAI
jgi:hypothetical protein